MSSSFRKALVVKRHAAGTWNKGRYTEGAQSDINITASVQPATPEEMNLLPEGRSISETFRLYTSTKLLPANSSAGINADIVIIDGENYEVLSCATWQNDVINHYKAIVSKVTNT